MRVLFESYLKKSEIHELTNWQERWSNLFHPSKCKTRQPPSLSLLEIVPLSNRSKKICVADVARKIVVNEQLTASLSSKELKLNQTLFSTWIFHSLLKLLYKLKLVIARVKISQNGRAFKNFLSSPTRRETGHTHLISRPPPLPPSSSKGFSRFGIVAIAFPPYSATSSPSLVLVSPPFISFVVCIRGGGGRKARQNPPVEKRMVDCADLEANCFPIGYALIGETQLAASK